MERVPEPRAGHAAPGRAELERVCLPEIFHGREAPSRRPRPHPRGHPWQVLEVEREQTARQVLRMQHGQAIRLVEVRGDLGEPAVRGVADGTRDVSAHGVTEALLDLVREGRRDIAGRHRGGELVNGAHGIDGQHVENRRDDTVVDARVEIGLLGDQRDPRAPSAGVRDGHARRDPGALGHRVGGNHAALDGSRERDDPQGLALQPAIGLFFTGGKEAIEINVQLLRGGRLPHPAP